MELKKIYFDAYKSLLNKELEIYENCIGFVGINESGKSNILDAIRILGNETKLKLSDTPKMAKNQRPKVRFEFELSSTERNDIIKKILKWTELKSPINDGFKKSEFKIIYTIEFNSKSGSEERYFTLTDINLEKDLLILDTKGNSNYKIKIDDKFVSITDAVIINKMTLKKNEDYLKNCSDLIQLQVEIGNLKQELKKIEQQQEELVKSGATDTPIENANVVVERKESSELLKLRNRISKLSETKSNLEKEVGSYNLISVIEDDKVLLKESLSKIETTNTNIKTIQSKITELEGINSKTPDQTTELTQNQEKLTGLNVELNKLQKQSQITTEFLSFCERPLNEMYSENYNNLNLYLKEELKLILTDLIPTVVYWEYSDKYILESKTSFSEILNKKSLTDLSRPLVNVFRICLGITTIEELKSKINEIKKDESERYRYNNKCNTNIGLFLKEVWPDYKQKIKINLEEHQILIQFFDPECGADASHYSMSERSQGCQTYISFLLTIGAEAKNDVIKNTILLLDEPETHLHPSGVKFMLKELIKIAENKNKVIFSTHSIFMIDRENFNRHIILSKEKEYTQLQPSSFERIGFFMQEEVLYGALNTNLSKDFKTTTQHNFVFEGDGDVSLFKWYYENILTDKERPFKLKECEFFHGGGCKNITKYFSNTPILLGSKWIVILDKDNPADNLKKMLEARYKDFLNKYVFIYQYDDSKLKELELEDILPQELIIDAYKKTDELLGINIDQKNVAKVIKAGISFVEYDDEILESIYLNHKESFKPKFKEVLNNLIIAKLKNIKKESFIKTFPEYDIWIKNTIALIIKSQEKEK